MEQPPVASVPEEHNLISALPDEVWLMIASNFDGVQLALCHRVCRRWRRIFSDSVLWKRLYERDFVLLWRTPEEKASVEAAKPEHYAGAYALFTWNWYQFLRADRSPNTKDRFRRLDKELEKKSLHPVERAYLIRGACAAIALEVMKRLVKKVVNETGDRRFLDTRSAACKILLEYWKIPTAPAAAMKALVDEMLLYKDRRDHDPPLVLQGNIAFNVAARGRRHPFY